MAFAGNDTTVLVDYNNRINILGKLKDLEIPSNMGLIKTVAIGDDHILFLNQEGQVFAVGLNGYGQCNIPPAMQMGRVVSIAAGYEHSLFLNEEGKVFAIGDNLYGQCTIPPAMQMDMGRIVSIAAGKWHSLFLNEEGK